MSKKEVIVQTALDLFDKFTYGSVGVNRIIEEAGVNKVTFYKCFSSKEKLLVFCLIRRKENIQAEIMNELEVINENDHLGKIKAVYNWHITWFKSESFNGSIFQKATFEVLRIYPSIIQPIKDYRSWLYHLSEGLFAKLSISDPQVLASIFICIIDGMAIYANMTQDYEKIEQSWGYIEKFVLPDQNKDK